MLTCRARYSSSLEVRSSESNSGCRTCVSDEVARILCFAGNAGIGLETVKGLALRGALVILGSRNVKKAQHAVHELQQTAGSQQMPSCSSHSEFCNHTQQTSDSSGGNLDLHIFELDLADLASVKGFALQVQAFLHGRKIDALVRAAAALLHLMSSI